MASSAVADELHMKTTEPQTTNESVEEPAPKTTEAPNQSSLEASPAQQVKDDTAAPATMSGVKDPESADSPEAEKEESTAAAAAPPVSAPTAGMGEDATQTLNQERPQDEPQDVVATLHSLFSNLDRETIEDVYQGEGGDADRTAQLLLQLSGQGEASEIDAALHHSQEQISADEAFARQLQEEERQASQPQQQQYANLTYQPRVTPRAGPPPSQHGHQQQQPQAEHDGGRDDFDQALEQMKAGVATATEYGRGLFNKLSTRFQQQMQVSQEGGAEGHPQPQPARHGFFSSHPQQQHETQNDQTPTRPRPQQQPQRSNSGRMAPALPHADRYRQANKAKQDSVSSADAPALSPQPTQQQHGGATGAQQTHSPSGLEDEQDSASHMPGLKNSKQSDADEDGSKQAASTTAPQRIAVRNNDSDSDDDEYVKNPFDDRD